MLLSEALQCIHLLPVSVFKPPHSSCHAGADSGRPPGQHYLCLLVHVRNACKSHQAPLGCTAGGAQEYTSLQRRSPNAAWHDPTGACPSLLNFHHRGPASLLFQASGSWDKSVRIRDPLSGVLLLLLEGHACWLKSTCFSRSGLLLATAGYSETLAQSIF